MQTALKRMLVHQVLVAPHVSTGGGGARTYGPDRIVRARVEPEQRLVRDRNGREVASSTVVFLEPVDLTGATLTLGLDDRVTLPAGFAPQAPPIISIHPHYAARRNAVDHFEVRL